MQADRRIDAREALQRQTVTAADIHHRSWMHMLDYGARESLPVAQIVKIPERFVVRIGAPGRGAGFVWSREQAAPV